MEDHLHHIKNLVDSLAAIQSLVSHLELIQFTTSGLPPDYHTFVITYSMLPSSHTDDLRSKLMFYEQCLNLQNNRDIPIHQALVSTISSGGSNSQVLLTIRITMVERVRTVVDDVNGTIKDVIKRWQQELQQQQFPIE